MPQKWPKLDYGSWKDTGSALQLYCQILGKYRLAHTPWHNHSWHATLYVNARGLTTSLIPDAGGIEIQLDLHNHRVVGANAAGAREDFALGPGTVAEFHRRFDQMIQNLGGTPARSDMPSEIADAVPFSRDHQMRPYGRDAVTRYFSVLLSVDPVFKAYSTSFLGKSSPVHLFWGAFDLAVTRFSGRRAPLHPGNMPGLPDAVVREAYDHEVASVGFWPGGSGSEEAAFYAYAYPTPTVYPQQAIEPSSAAWSSGLGEFILPYEAVRTSDNPEATLTAFLNSTYRAAATTGEWDRERLECEPGVPLVPRRARPL